MSKAKTITNNKGGDITKIPLVSKHKRQWYDFITPLLGIKWGAEITLIGYTWVNHPESDGLRLATIITTIFLFLEWCRMAWSEFKRSTK